MAKNSYELENVIFARSIRNLIKDIELLFAKQVYYSQFVIIYSMNIGFHINFNKYNY